MKAQRRLRKFVKFATGGLHRLRYLLHWILGKYSAKHIRLDGDLDLLGRNICIFSIFCHEKRIPRSTLALTRAIKRAGYDLIVVLNGAHGAREEFQNGLGSRDILITRPNLGRDFAAYQLVTNLLLAKKRPFDRILYCNDSVFYLDRNDANDIFRHLLSSDHPWIGMTENYPRYHVSSWCFQLSSHALMTPVLTGFWKRYRPVDSHHHAVKAGEQGLTGALLKAGFVPTIMFDAASLLKAILRKYRLADDGGVLQQLSPPPAGSAPSSQSQAVLASLYQGERANQANHLSMLLISELGFPFVKKKLARQGYCPISLLVLVLEKFMSDFCLETVHEVRLTGMRMRKRWF
jgi:hypothetical protein